eukprot:Blabericola_migrator_1__652@NODE_1161_length_5239_cov_261_079660_g791_i0_p1_GENE_NODE_1161_length_5239_cov_261_079660_g791_i0NODE_1161_length_5239_cov_261_079660_g791_i0_p1_ORF_typecomplete_len593_score53_90TRI12/PF06609_13/6_7e79MFS_1/PF07690_16/7e18MFS_1/PF07690_16/2_4e13Sugar_tr/PF00083_24/1_3e06Sugar_tr/PF00083_24/0_004OATP/PF03137_20/1_8e02OATP/PF03137_20/0_0011MFS_4/PF06779_14/8_9MFS_4/PF06779_14/0_0094MFS_4/PF06779_14/3_5MFS_4/PF06779_14/2e03DUF4381/PF14316_6/1_2DUF4381/PF14316_6/4_6e02_N
MYEGAWSRGLIILIYAGLFLLGTSTSLEGQTTYTFTPYITSGFAAHSMLTTVSVVYSVLNTCLKAPIAKISEVFGRFEALTLCMCCYALGYIMISQSPNVETYAASQIFYVCGFTGTLMVIQLVVADTSSLVNRTLVSIMPTLPFLWTVWAGPALGQYLLKAVGWRWGAGMWAIIIPACSIPVLIGLFIARRRSRMLAKRSVQNEGLDNITRSEQSATEENPKLLGKREDILHTINQLDLPGVVLIVGGLGLLLVPLTLPRDQPTDIWKSWRTWVCFACGIIVLCIFGWYDGYKAKYPLISLKSLKNRTIACLCASQALDWAAFYIYDTMFVSFLQVARFRSQKSAGHIQNCYSFASTGSAIIAGLLIKYTKRYRLIVWIGAFLNIAGIILMIPFRAPGHHIAWLVFAQTLIGIGGGFYATPGMVVAQGWAPHGDVGAVTALYLSSGPFGSGFGTAIAGGMWASLLKSRLRMHLPASADQETLVTDIAGSIVVAMSYPEGSEIRNAIVAAYSDVMHRLCWAAAGVGVVFFCSTLLAQNPPEEKEEEPVKTLEDPVTSKTASVTEIEDAAGKISLKTLTSLSHTEPNETLGSD